MDLEILKELITEKREALVTKNNQFIINSKYDLSLKEQKLIAFIFSQIKLNEYPDNPHALECEFYILDFIRTCGLFNNGRESNQIKSLLQQLRDKSIWIKIPKGTEATIAWLDNVEIFKRTGKVKCRIREDLATYMMGIQGLYISYELKNILLMRNKHSIRLYELLKVKCKTEKSSLTKKSTEAIWTADLKELKQHLLADKKSTYDYFSKFKNELMDLALKEINELTDITVSYRPIALHGRSVEKIRFLITEKDKDEKRKISEAIDKRLGFPE